MSQVRKYAIEFEAAWEPRKANMMKRDLEQLVRQEGAKHVVMVRRDPEDAEPELAWIKILCKPCESIFYSKNQVIPCPKCGGRDIERLGRVAAPPEMPTGDTTDAEAAEALEAAGVTAETPNGPPPAAGAPAALEAEVETGPDTGEPEFTPPDEAGDGPPELPEDAVDDTALADEEGPVKIPPEAVGG